MENKKSYYRKTITLHNTSQQNLDFINDRDINALQACDQQLVLFDVMTNLAHSEVLLKAAIINQQEYNDIKKGLKIIINLNKQNKFILKPELEDVHMNIEHFLTNDLKIVAAQKIHTARSRNDQVATDMRLYIRHEMSNIINANSKFAKALIGINTEIKNYIIPGFTHYQPAMVTTLGHLMAAWTEAELRSLKRMFSCLKKFNSCPLGSAAGYGTSWAVDRHLAARLLGFEHIDNNSLDAVSSRGEMEAETSFALAIACNNWSRIAQDLILYSHPYFGFIKILNTFSSGSSIMPQKINPDILEVIRSKAAYAQGQLQTILSTIKGLPTGYNKDQQATKPAIMDLLKGVKSIPNILYNIVNTIEVNDQASKIKTEQDYLMATDIANWLAINCQLSFRESYTIIKDCLQKHTKANKTTDLIDSIKHSLTKQQIKIPQNWSECKIDPKDSINRRLNRGSPSADMLKIDVSEQNQRLTIFLKRFYQFVDNFQQATSNLLN